MGYRNISYNTELRICDETMELCRKTEHIRRSKNKQIRFEVPKWTFEGCSKTKMKFKNILTPSPTIPAEFPIILYLFQIEVRDSRTGYLIPGRDATRAQPNAQSSWETVAAAAAAAAAVAVTWKLRSTFRPGNYIWRFSYGFGLLVIDLGEWRPGFYTEFRCASREHSGLAWGAIF